MIKFFWTGVTHKLLLSQYQTQVTNIHKQMQKKTVNRSEKDMLGWLASGTWSKSKLNQYLSFGAQFRQEIKVLVVIGIGGSFLGIKACYEWWAGLYGVNVPIKMIFLGNSLGGREIAETIHFLKDQKYGICVISKSGTTVEPLVALNILTKHLKNNYGLKFYQQHVVVITTSRQGKLFALAQQEGWRAFGIDLDIGGRYSFLSSVGLIPMAICGFDIKAMIAGTKQASLKTSNPDLEFNSAYQYAVARFLMYHVYHYRVEVMGVFDQSLASFGMWWQQLFAESEGKDGKGLLPICCSFTRDLHSLEQFFQQGTKNLLFQTIFEPFFSDHQVQLETHAPTVDRIYDLPMIGVDQINRFVFESIVHSNQQSKIPTFRFGFKFKNQNLSYVFGYLTFWFMRSCAVSAQLLKVNPFNQPGVENYKRILRTKMKLK